MNKMLILCTTAFVISACAVVVKYIQTGVFDVYKFAAVVCFAMLAFGSEDTRKQIERQFGISLVRVPLSVDAFSVDYKTMQWFERIL